MKRSAFVPFLLMILPACPVVAEPQGIFELLHKGDVQAVEARVEKSLQILEARDGDGMMPLHYAAMAGSADLTTTS